MTSETAAAAPTTGRRARARAEMTRRILDAATDQLADDGPAGLSLRAVAREVGVVSSAVHRYFPTRDDLLTALIIEAYDDLGRAMEASASETRDEAPRARWVEVARSVRRWARANPQRWALVYGSPVPGYAAPDDTIGPGARAPLVLLGIVADAAADGRLAPRPDPPLPDPLPDDLAALARDQGLDLPPPVLVRTIAAWTQLFGLVGFELFGQTKNLTGDDEALLATTAGVMADLIGIEDRG